MKRAACIALLAALTGCTVGPNFVPPTLVMPVHYAESDRLPGGTDRERGLATWWSGLRDPLLDELERRALADNPGIRVAQSRVIAARLGERVAGAAALPSLTAVGNIAHLETGGAPIGGIALPSHTTVYSAGFDASWEIDLFGGTRRAVEAARAQTDAADWARRDGQVSLVAEIANDYWALRVVQLRSALFTLELARRHDLLTLIAARRSTGFVTQTDVNQRTQDIDDIAAQLPSLAAEARVLIHAIGVLIGQPPEYLTVTLQPTSAALPPPPAGLPPELPAELLRRRPDIREAQARLAAASATIGVQQAALYPKLDLRGIAAFGSTALGSLFASQNLVAAGIGMASQPIFDGGRRRANVAIARQDYVQARLAWQAAVLGALRDVENALARYSAETARNAELARSVASAQSDLVIAQDQARTGLVPDSTVLVAQVNLLTARDRLIQSDGQVLANRIALYKALGGTGNEAPF